MMYLIVPPIIIIVAIAMLIVFLTRVLSSKNNTNQQLQFVDDESGVKGTLKRSKNFLKTKSAKTSKRIKNSLGSTRVVKSNTKYNGDSIMTQGITTDETIENIVSLKKKSMISDKLDSDEERDENELQLMKEIEEDPKNSKKYEMLGDYYMEQEKFEDARDCYKYVLRLDPRHKRAQVAMKNLDRVL